MQPGAKVETGGGAEERQEGEGEQSLIADEGRTEGRDDSANEGGTAALPRLTGSNTLLNSPIAFMIRRTLSRLTGRFVGEKRKDR